MVIRRGPTWTCLTHFSRSVWPFLRYLRALIFVKVLPLLSGIDSRQNGVVIDATRNNRDVIR